jgi:hypothetical protein
MAIGDTADVNKSSWIMKVVAAVGNWVTSQTELVIIFQ